MKKKILSIFLCVLMLCSVFVFASCTGEQTKEETNDTETPELDDNVQFVDNLPDVMSADGTPMVSNTTYKMARSGIAFCNVTALSETASEGITLTANVTPSYATKTAVDWTVAFANPESTWATGKTVTDYVTITPIEDGSLTATLECLAPFGEQIIVSVKSRENAEISDTCPIEYMRRVEAVSIHIGDLVFTPNGENRVDFEVATGNTGKGGDAWLDIDFTDVYTTSTWAGSDVDISDLSQWGFIGGNGSIGNAASSSFVGQTSDGVQYTGIPNFCYSEFSTKQNVTFDVDNLTELGAYLIKDSAGTTYNINKVDPALLVEILTDAKAKGTDTLFWFEVIHPSNHRINIEVKLGNIVNSGVAPETIELSMNTYAFNAEELDYLKFGE